MTPTLGVCYYPEHWPEEIWAEDAARMAETGLSWVRIGEFAWSRMEPAPGELQFDWLDRAIETLGAAGLKVILGTPTATPPRWMLEKHPDMLPWGADGTPRGFGSRRHYCFSHEGYLQESKRITEILAKRYGGNPHVQAWQTDNEYDCHDTTLSYSPAAKRAFQDWLAQRYQSPDALNRAWGNVFWSMEYAEFSEIDLPNLTVTEPNPAHVLAFRRFSSDQVVRFNRAQTDIIRQHSDAPIIHNYMGRTLTFDHFDVGADLEIASWDSYPLGFLSQKCTATDAHKRRYLRQGDPDWQGFHHDLYRAVGAARGDGPSHQGRWWIMEQQPGPVNWAPWNPAPLDGMPRLWAWEAFAHGAETVCYFRWRQATFAQEQMHAGLLRPDSQPAPALAEAAQVAREIAEMGALTQERADVAILFDYSSAWAWEAQPQGADFNYFDLVFDHYKGLRKLGLNVDILPLSTREIADYKLVLAPGILALPSETANALAETVSLVGPRTNSKTTEMSIPHPMGPNIPGLEVTVSRVESLPPSTSVALKTGAFIKWFEQLETPLPSHTETADGRPAIVNAGSTFYQAGWPDSVGMHAILTELCRVAGVATCEMPDGLRQRHAGGKRFLFNYGPQPVSFDGIELPAAGVFWS
jgi:beta-galactosidase